MAVDDEKLASLTRAFPDLKILSSAADKEHYGQDWTRFYPPKPVAIIFPRQTQDVVNIVLWARENQVALVPSGGRTGLSAGAVATQGELVVAFDQMNQVIAFDEFDQSVQVQAGVVTEQLQNFAEEKGLYYPVDFASAGSSQIGGNIATNAGGIKVIRYGMTRDWISGLTVVTGEGKLLHLNKGLIKNNTGYDLKNLFIGSEGTLGFITEASIQLSRSPSQLSVMVLGLPELDSIFPVMKAFREALQLTAFEFFSEPALQKVLASSDLDRPFAESTPFYALIEFENNDEKVMELAFSVFERCLEEGWCLDGVISQSDTQADKLWRLREDISESITPYTPYKNDISVRISKVPKLLEEVDQVVKQNYPNFETIWFGHIGDGNLHLNILKPSDLDVENFKAECNKVSELIFQRIQAHDGSISAEHGVGLLKKPFLHYTRSEDELNYFKSLKLVFDPDNILNPGKLIDL